MQWTIWAIAMTTNGTFVVRLCGQHSSGFENGPGENPTEVSQRVGLFVLFWLICHGCVC